MSGAKSKESRRDSQQFYICDCDSSSVVIFLDLVLWSGFESFNSENASDLAGISRFRTTVIDMINVLTEKKVVAFR